MSVNRLLSLIADQGGKPRRAAVARWTETPEAAWGLEPEYGAFVDEDGVVVPGIEPARAFLEADDVQSLELVSSVARDGTLVFLDWGRLQPLPWNELFSLWDQWERKGFVADCGAVATAWNLETRWVSPGWILFRGDFDGSPLQTTVIREPETVSEQPELPPKAKSFLAIAKALRGETVSFKGVPAGNFPMLPFTLSSLQDVGHSWPAGL